MDFNGDRLKVPETTSADEEERQGLCSADIYSRSTDAINNSVNSIPRPADRDNVNQTFTVAQDKRMPPVDGSPEVKPPAKAPFPADKPFPLPNKLSPEQCETCAQHIAKLMENPPSKADERRNFERDVREIFLRIPVKPEEGTMSREQLVKRINELCPPVVTPNLPAVTLKPPVLTQQFMPPADKANAYYQWMIINSTHQQIYLGHAREKLGKPTRDYDLNPATRNQPNSKPHMDTIPPNNKSTDKTPGDKVPGGKPPEKGQILENARTRILQAMQNCERAFQNRDRGLREIQAGLERTIHQQFSIVYGAYGNGTPESIAQITALATALNGQHSTGVRMVPQGAQADKPDKPDKPMPQVIGIYHDLYVRAPGGIEHIISPPFRLITLPGTGRPPSKSNP